MNSKGYKKCFSSDSILLAWERVISSVGTDAKDYFGISLYSSNLSDRLKKLTLELENGEYYPTRPFKYYEPKLNGTQRTKTVLGIKDAIVYQAIANYVAELTYDYFTETKHFVFGSVLSPDVKKGVSILNEDVIDFYFFEYYVSLYNRFVESINETVDKLSIIYRLETDITSFFDTIPHSTLVIELNRFKIDKDVLELLSSCLNFWSGTRDSETIGVGIPQGPAASYFFANLILDSLDRMAMENDLTYFRFMDDIRIYDSDKKRLNSALISFDRHLKGKSLSINIKKTSIQEVEHLEKEKGRLLDASGIKIKKTKKSKEVDVDILEHDSSQISGDEEKNITAINNKEALSYYYKAIQEIEDELSDIYYKTKDENILESSFLTDVKLVRRFLTLAQKWRLITKNLIDLDDKVPDYEMVHIWLFGISRIYWKSNNLIWNLTYYDDLSDYHKDFNELMNKFKDYEWVKYQLLAVYDKTVDFNSSKVNLIIKKINNEDSPLVRLGYYKMLVKKIKLNSQISDSLAHLIKSETETYVQETVLNLIHTKHLNIPIDNLKSWFL
ncbi:RNA-directed DNA polymerase [Flagellimonas sp. S3867]|uniref:RNA-directed DNA polymerase n=1 Tax=Flagellimonas sp. S3867 TaxID=2768063 RepID=UPI0016830847|nr:RNA-directed DNA polymerase [Flagellimonas sp. S3867]